MRFSMASDYVGTPNITLVTPEKSSALNFIELLINNHRPNTMLRDLIQTEPMFMPAFTLQKELFDFRKDADKSYRIARLRGTGLRRHAEIWINNVPLCKTTMAEDCTSYDQRVLRQTTGDYEIRFRNSGTTPEKYSIRYRQNAIFDIEADEFDYTEPVRAPAKEAFLMNYAPNATTAEAAVDVRFKKTGLIVRSAKVSPVEAGHIVGGITTEGNDGFRATFRTPDLIQRFQRLRRAPRKMT